MQAEAWLDVYALHGVVADARSAHREAVLAVIDGWIEEVTAWMKANAPWQDRTTNARTSLGVVQELRGELINLYLTGGVYYMKYLELYFAGRYRILAPAFAQWWPTLMQRLNAVEEG
jgi:hypothetical protein